MVECTSLESIVSLGFYSVICDNSHLYLRIGNAHILSHCDREYLWPLLDDQRSAESYSNRPLHVDIQTVSTRISTRTWLYVPRPLGRGEGMPRAGDGRPVVAMSFLNVCWAQCPAKPVGTAIRSAHGLSWMCDDQPLHRSNILLNDPILLDEALRQEYVACECHEC